jgi:hypothetical protein
MSDTPDDEVQAAFPDRYRDGMTLRDYFAAEALSSPICLELSSTNNWDNERRSEWTYKQADAMLKAREA